MTCEQLLLILGRLRQNAEGKMVHISPAVRCSSSASAQRTLGGDVDLLPRARRGLGERMLQPE